MVVLEDGRVHIMSAVGMSMYHTTMVNDALRLVKKLFGSRVISVQPNKGGGFPFL